MSRTVLKSIVLLGINIHPQVDVVAIIPESLDPFKTIRGLTLTVALGIIGSISVAYNVEIWK